MVTRVLVVDDEPNICVLLSRTLRLVDYEVRTAGGGAQALVAADEFDPDIVVLDVMLPDLDGFEVARRLRGAGRSVPVLFLTARDSVEDRICGLTGTMRPGLKPALRPTRMSPGSRGDGRVHHVPGLAVGGAGLGDAGRVRATLVIGGLAGIYPAARAARLAPTDALATP